MGSFHDKSLKLRIVFASNEITGKDMELFFEWHRRLREDRRYGGAQDLEPATRVPKQQYTFRKRAVEFYWMDYALLNDLACAAEDIDGMWLERWSDKDKWQRVKTYRGPESPPS